MRRYAGATDPGKVRSGNQDAYYCDPEGRYFIVADGMGGHAAGAVASQLAVETIRAYLDRGWEMVPAPKLLSEAVEAANEAILKDQRENPQRADMGTTVVVAMVDPNNNCWSAHIGDSRLYRLRGSQLQQMTEDHTLVARSVRQGELTQEQARIHPWRHILERCLGRPDTGPPAIQPITLLPGDRLLLCSDGLTEELDDEVIAEYCLKVPDLEQLVLELIEAAKERDWPYPTIQRVGVALAVKSRGLPVISPANPYSSKTAAQSLDLRLKHLQVYDLPALEGPVGKGSGYVSVFIEVQRARSASVIDVFPFLQQLHRLGPLARQDFGARGIGHLPQGIADSSAIGAARFLDGQSQKEGSIVGSVDVGSGGHFPVGSFVGLNKALVSLGVSTGLGRSANGSL
jgi:protein phosphatase